METEQDKKDKKRKERDKFRSGKERTEMEHIGAALEIMWKGMAGIFAVVLVIMIIVYLLGKFGK